MADREDFSSSSFYIFICISLTLTINHSHGSLVVNFDSLQNVEDLPTVNRHSLTKRDTSNDETCTNQENAFLSKLKSNISIDDSHTFNNESKYAMALAWAGTNDGTLIIVTSDDVGGTTVKSSVYISKDFGKNFVDLTEQKNIAIPIKKHNGLQRNPHDPKKVYLITDSTSMYITEDGGDNFTLFTNLPMRIEGELIFHSNKDYNRYIMAKSSIKDLFITYDNGRNWKKIQSKVDHVFWGVLPDPAIEKPVNPDNAKTIYLTTGGAENIDPIFQHFFNMGSLTTYTLRKSTDGGETWNVLLNNVVSFERKGKFLYASIIKDGVDANGWRQLKISSNGGSTWEEAQLPTIEHDRFYSVMDIEDNMIFMHVDDEHDTGHGTLYVSANQGIIYSESLPRHLYPNYGKIHDFYKVQSMRGVYITSQMSDDDSIHTMITYNRGATWQSIPRPEGVPCKDESKECFLQLHGMYSLKRGINALPPISEKTATGIIMAHGHVAESLQKTAPDVFVSSDGGYSWRLSLKGPHHYQIGDHGGLLVAVSKEEVNPKIIKFSTDEGRCWHDYTFTSKTLNFTGLLTEPEGKSSVVMIWGYVASTRKWEVHVIDFKTVIQSQCSDKDYEIWMARNQDGPGVNDKTRGCFLGVKETFKRLKKDSWCYNGYGRAVLSSIQDCVCTRDDYECDYGYYRPGGSEKCVKIPEFKKPEIDICLHGHDEKIISEGYRKIPGDKCKDGFEPKSTKIDLSKQCDENGKSIVEFNEELSATKPNGVGRIAKILAFGIVILVLILASIMGVYFIRKFVLLRRHRVEYRYSILNQSEQQTHGDDDDRDWGHDLDNALSSSGIRYQDSDEEELTTTVRPASSRRPTSRQNGVAKQTTKDSNPFGSYHDDSDDDMLS